MTHRVLVIDDDSAIRDALAFLLSRNGYEVVTAAGGAEGIALFREHGPTVVLTDLTMPGIPGVDVIRQIRGGAPSVLIVAMSGLEIGGPESIQGGALAAGADTRVEKPFDPTELLEILETFLAPKS
jgi:two-component system response regulator RegX3